MLNHRKCQSYHQVLVASDWQWRSHYKESLRSAGQWEP